MAELSPIQSSKLSPPGNLGTLLPRSSLASMIAMPGSAKVTVVWGPAGFGKTSAMLQGYAALEENGTQVAWLTLDAADNDLPRFLALLTEATRRLELNAKAIDGPLDVLDALGNDSAPFAIFLDEFDVLQSRAVIDLVAEIVERLPRNGRLVIGSRTLPAIGLGRLRARRHLVEIDASLLRFSEEETSRIIKTSGAGPLSSSAISQLHAKTEGWAAAIWLASMALARQDNAEEFIANFSGSTRAIADYLADDVLASQPGDIQDFLLRTSILKHLSPELCKAVVPDADCAGVLAQLEAGNIFISALEGEEAVYRYHSLFAQFLKARLQREQPASVAPLHLAASRWYERAGRPVPAIDHAIEGGDKPHALELLEQHADRFLKEGRMRSLAKWLNALSAEWLDNRPTLQAAWIWASCFTQGPHEAIALVDQLKWRTSQDPRVAEHLSAIEPLLLLMLDRFDEAYDIGRKNLSLAEPGNATFANGVLRSTMAYTLYITGRQREAHALLDSMRKSDAPNSLNRMFTESTEGLLDMEQGRLRQATARFSMAMRVPRDAGSHGFQALPLVRAGVAHATALYESHDLEKVDRLLNIYLPLARELGTADHMILTHVMKARMQVAHGAVDDAHRLITELQDLGHQKRLVRVTASAQLERARMLTLKGDSQAAAIELGRANEPDLWERVHRQHLPAHFVDNIATARLRWELHFGDPEACSAAIDEHLRFAAANTLVQRAIKLKILKSIALWRIGSNSQALGLLRDQLAACCSEGYVRLVLDEGPILLPALKELLVSPLEDPILSEYCERMHGLLAPTGNATAAPEPREDGLELTQKELRVVRLLAEGHSNTAIAAQLFVSVSTVRTHLRNIYPKLGAANRTQAAGISRQKGLI